MPGTKGVNKKGSNPLHYWFS